MRPSPTKVVRKHLARLRSDKASPEVISKWECVASDVAIYEQGHEDAYQQGFETGAGWKDGMKEPNHLFIHNYHDSPKKMVNRLVEFIHKITKPAHFGQRDVPRQLAEAMEKEAANEKP